MNIKKSLLFITSLLLTCMPARSQLAPDTSLLRQWMQERPELFSAILNGQKDFQVQLIYTRIDRDKKNRPRFRDHFYETDTGRYFYPASTVKLPVAVLALQKLHELNIPGLDRNSTMITGAAGDRQTEVLNDPTAPDGRPTIAHYIKKILLVSDNDAFNRLYEFLGQEYINDHLHQMGYPEVQIIHRLEVSLTEAENRHTNPVSFYDSSGKLLYQQPARISRLPYAKRDTKMGKGFMRAGQLVPEPFDFSGKNRMALTTLHGIVKSILFPGAVEQVKRFDLPVPDLDFLRKYMSMLPAESRWPRYDSAEIWDTYVKFLYYGSVKNTANPDIRLFNKPGDAYGFLTDAAYIADFRTGTEFLLSAVIHCNSDGVYNDDAYDYEKTGLPFMKNIGRLIMEHEQTRVRKHRPDLRTFLFSYTD